MNVGSWRSHRSFCESTDWPAKLSRVLSRRHGPFAHRKKSRMARNHRSAPRESKASEELRFFTARCPDAVDFGLFRVLSCSVGDRRAEYEGSEHSRLLEKSLCLCMSVKQHEQKPRWRAVCLGKSLSAVPVSCALLADHHQTADSTLSAVHKIARAVAERPSASIVLLSPRLCLSLRGLWASVCQGQTFGESCPLHSDSPWLISS